MSPDTLTVLGSLASRSDNENNNEQDPASDSTIELEFSESVLKMLGTGVRSSHDNNAIINNNNSNSKSCIRADFDQSSRRSYAQKRNASVVIDGNKDQQTSLIVNKKQRCSNEHPAFSDNALKITNIDRSLLENEGSAVDSSQYIRKDSHNAIGLKRSVSVQNDGESHFDWFKDLMRHSLDALRDTMVQACVTALSFQSTSLSHPSTSAARAMNINSHVLRSVKSEHSFTTHKTEDSWQNHRLGIKKNDVLTPYNRAMIRDDEDEEEEDDKKQRIHHRARSNPYPMYSHLFRTPVSDARVPWSYDWPQYKPTIFTADEIYINPGADPDLPTSSSSVSLHFNTVDGAIDRRSVYHRYHIRESDGLPLNPIGRTGLQGRGILLHWGPNIYHYVIICRWKRDIHGAVLLHPSNGKKILEVLLEIQTDGFDTSDLVLTGGLRMIGSRFPPQLQDRLKRFVYHAGTICNSRKKILTIDLNRLFQRIPTTWKGAYFDDARNTDNAWIELSIEYLLDHSGQLTSCIPRLNHDQLYRLEQPRFVWKEVRATVDIGPRTHYRLLRNLASKLDAHF